MAAMLKDGRHLKFLIGTRTFLKRVRSICRNQMLVSQFERFLYSWSVVCWTIGSFRVKSITFRPFLNHPTPIFMKFCTVVSCQQEKN